MKFCAELLFADQNSTLDEEHSVDSDITFDFETFCREMSENEDTATMSYEEKASMATIDDKYSKGSVDVARGKRMTLMPSSSEKNLRRKSILKEIRKRQTVLKIRRASLKSLARDSKSEEELRGSILTLGSSFSRGSSKRDRGTLISFSSADVIIRGSSAEF